MHNLIGIVSNSQQHQLWEIHLFTSDVWIIKVGYRSQLLDIDKGALNTYDEIQLQQFQQQQKKLQLQQWLKILTKLG